MEWLKELDDLERLATPGPWERKGACADDCSSCAREYPHGGQDAIVQTVDKFNEIITCDSGVYGPTAKDARLICLLRNHAREIIEALHRLEGLER